jgi:hypothetical protein
MTKIIKDSNDVFLLVVAVGFLLTALAALIGVSLDFVRQDGEISACKDVIRMLPEEDRAQGLADCIKLRKGDD